jgi:hypothetical protein
LSIENTVCSPDPDSVVRLGPALILNYLGQAPLLLTDPYAVDKPFYRLVPGRAQPPLVVLATSLHRARGHSRRTPRHPGAVGW